MDNNTEDKEALDILSKLEESGDVKFDKEEKKVTSLGKASRQFMSDAGESPWKLVALNTLPSKGMMHDVEFEQLIKSAKTKEIRHWSTIDEYDPVDIFDKIAYVTESCSKLNIKGSNARLNSNDILEIDKYHILFKIHKITFPNAENKLMAKVKCTSNSCDKISSIHTTDTNLQGFSYPMELMEWYSEEERCFVIPSEKLNETIRLYMPTIGVTKVVNEYKELCLIRGLSEDEAFDKIVPYLIDSWRTTSAEKLLELRSESNRWSENKFLFLHGATEALIKNSKNKVLGICEKCKSKIASSIFLGGSFTVKDIFIVSSRLRDLI